MRAGGLTGTAATLVATAVGRLPAPVRARASSLEARGTARVTGVVGRPASGTVGVVVGSADVGAVVGSADTDAVVGSADVGAVVGPAAGRGAERAAAARLVRRAAGGSGIGIGSGASAGLDVPAGGPAMRRREGRGAGRSLAESLPVRTWSAVALSRAGCRLPVSPTVVILAYRGPFALRFSATRTE